MTYFYLIEQYQGNDTPDTHLLIFNDTGDAIVEPLNGINVTCLPPAGLSQISGSEILKIPLNTNNEAPFVCGGFGNEKSCKIFVENQWKTENLFKFGRNDFASVYVNSQIIAIGGDVRGSEKNLEMKSFDMYKKFNHETPRKFVGSCAVASKNMKKYHW